MNSDLSIEEMNKDYYKSKIEENSIALNKIRSRLRIFPFLKLLFFLTGVFLVIATYRWGWDRTICFILAALSLAVFSLLYKWDEHYLQKRAYHGALQRVYTDEISFLDGDYSPFDNGEPFIDKKHAYSYDLDIFGENSIYHMINRTVTHEAGAILAEKLSSIPKSEEEIVARQESLSELVRKDDFRHQFMAVCKGFDEEKNDYRLITTHKGDNTLLTSKTGLLLLCISIAITLTSLILAWLGYLPWAVFVTLFMIQLFLPVIFSQALNKVGADIGFLHKNNRIHADLLHVVHQETFEASQNRTLKEKLFGIHNSREALKELSILLKKFDQRHNAYILVLLNGFFLRDLFLLRQFYRWKNNYLCHLQSWISTLAEMEARVSQATYMFNLPEFIQPEITARADLLLDASGLGHPFISKEKRVNNDILIIKKQFLIITGANMAGKSTFLRTVGANYILAVSGMNVCASKFSFTLFHLFSSMRNTDDLSSGTSYFKAELERMRELIRYCRSHQHTLIILDELLKGTNSKDKLDGSILFLKKMRELPVTGIIATHDLELAKLENDLPGLFLNYCFEISLSEEERYSYKIQRGVSRNLNATYLLQKILREEL
ncbi:DNA mismatch repair protein MutS [Proteiniphilum sp. X52]|uniref:MutS-related protein n=1 Tax=Proteiniphilum sp. X52 TaxID=2382159 RepID=UPI000F0A68E9|nr:DNA mismatch repair protein MutS [Proteiniphilum sp. X52]RNC63719.1 DNA mismatch repair protein MutS [Proteiniphilum sp. X52]